MKTKSNINFNFILSFIVLLIAGNIFTAQAGGGCHVQQLIVINASSCNDNGTSNDPTDDYYTADVEVYYFDPILTGSLRIFGTALVAGQESVLVSALSGSPFTFSSVQFKATGAVETFFGEFTDEVPSCSQLSNPPIVQPCSDPCATNTEGNFIAPTPSCNSVFSVAPGNPLSFTISADDDDAGDVVTLTASGIPAGATLSNPLPAAGNPVSTTFSWTPGVGDVGFYYPDFTFTDICDASDHCSYTIEVTDPCATNNEPDFIAPTPACYTVFTVAPGSPLSFTVSADDIDVGDIVTLSANGIPAGATLSNSLPATGNPVSTTFDWTPGIADVGFYYVDFSFIDICGAQDGCSYTIEVTGSCMGNVAPEFISQVPACSSLINATSGVPMSFTVTASDADAGNIVTLTSTVPQAGATVTPALPTSGNPVSATFNWTPTSADVGPIYSIIFTATDNCGDFVICYYTIVVAADPCETNAAPAFIAPSPSCASVIPFPVGISNSFTVNVSDADVADVVTLDAAGVPATATLSSALPAAGNPAATNLSWTPAAADVGQHAVTFSVTDPCGQQRTCTYTLNVYDCSAFTVNAGADAQSFYGYAPQQTVTHTAAVAGGTPPYTYAWSMSRDLICNSVTTAGDESFSGGTCANVTCPTSGTPVSSAPFPSCTGSATISAALLANAVVCVTVTDAGGCIATDCFNIVAEDVRCFAGNSGPKKVKVCHHTNSTTNPWVQICVYKNAVHAHLVANPGDYLGICAPKLDNAAYSEEIEMFVYPNPAQNQVMVEFDSPSDAAYQLSVFDITGRVVLSSTGLALEGENTVVLPIHDIARGVYNIRLTVGDESSSVRLVVAE